MELELDVNTSGNCSQGKDEEEVREEADDNAHCWQLTFGFLGWEWKGDINSDCILYVTYIQSTKPKNGNGPTCTQHMGYNASENKKKVGSKLGSCGYWKSE